MDNNYLDRVISIIENLFKVKSIISILVTYTFCYLSLHNFFEKQDVLQVVMIVITFYFGTQSGKVTAAKEYKKIIEELKNNNTDSKETFK